MLESPIRLLARLPAPVRLLITGTLINKVGTFIVPYLTIVLLREFRLSETEAARLLFAYGAGSIVSILAGGWLTDRLGRRVTPLVRLFRRRPFAFRLGLPPSARVFLALPVLLRLVGDLYPPPSLGVLREPLRPEH